MNILLVTRDVKDGIGTTVKNLVWQFEKNPEIENITVICPSEFPVYSNKVKFSVVKANGKYFFTKEPLFAYFAYHRIVEELKVQKYDVIHLHSNILRFTFKSRENIISTFQGTHTALIKNVNVPIFSTFHGSKRATFSNINLSSIKYRFGRYLHLLFIFLDDRRIKNSDVITCVSKFTLEELKAISDKNKWNKEFHYIPNGIDTSIYKPVVIDRKQFLKEKYNIEIGDKKVGLYIGRLEAGKGVNLLAEAVKNIPNFILLVAGMGMERENLEKYPNIKCLGYVSNQEEKNLLLNTIDVFILPSFYENFPTVIPEAMAVRKAIVSTKVGMVPEVLGNRSAALVEIGNTEDLRLKIEAMINNPELASREAEENYNYAHNNLKWETISQIYLNLYKTKNENKNVI